MIIDISVAVIAVAFLALAIYLIILMVRLRKTLAHVDEALIEARMLEIDLKNKMASLDPLFNSVENVGEVIESKTASFRERQCMSKCEEDSDAIQVADIVALAGLGLRLWNKFSTRR